MPYFFLEDCELAPGREVSLAPADINHAYRVLRLRKGGTVTVSDGRGTACHGTVTAIGHGEALVCLERLAPAVKPVLELTLVQALARGEKMDLAVRQSVELGVTGILPLLTERSIPRWKEEREGQRLKRWQSIARSAAAQSRRPFLPAVGPVIDMPRLLSMAPAATVIVPWEEEKDLCLAGMTRRPRPGKGAVFVIIGPEGGFTRAEIEALLQAGARTVHLGPRILRLETAAVTALSLVQAGWGDLGGIRI